MKWQARYKARLRDRILRELFDGSNPEQSYEGQRVFFLAIPYSADEPRGGQRHEAVMYVAESARIAAAHAARKAFGSSVPIGKATLAS